MPGRRHTILLFALITQAMLGLWGCAHPDRGPRINGPCAQDLFFDDPAAMIPSEAMVRAEWPSSTAFSDASEFTVYRESIRDIMSGRWPAYDTLYRRFDSARIGRLHR